MNDIPKVVSVCNVTGKPIEHEVILLNQIRTPDGTILTSTHRHDYRTHIDANGKVYMVDGGNSYLRRTVHKDAPYEELSIYLDPYDHNHNREHFKWGTYGLEGKGPLRRVPLKDLDTDHIEAILETQKHVPEYFRLVFKQELKYRGDT